MFIVRLSTNVSHGNKTNCIRNSVFVSKTVYHTNGILTCRKRKLEDAGGLISGLEIVLNISWSFNLTFATISSAVNHKYLVNRTLYTRTHTHTLCIQFMVWMHLALIICDYYCQTYRRKAQYSEASPTVKYKSHHKCQQWIVIYDHFLYLINISGLHTLYTNHIAISATLYTSRTLVSDTVYAMHISEVSEREGKIGKIGHRDEKMCIRENNRERNTERYT